MKDVFGREMSLSPSTYKANPAPLAPYPVDHVTEQWGPVRGFSPAQGHGRAASFGTGKGEAMGAACHISGSQRALISGISETAATEGYHGSYTLPSIIHR